MRLHHALATVCVLTGGMCCHTQEAVRSGNLAGEEVERASAELQSDFPKGIQVPPLVVLHNTHSLTHTHTYTHIRFPFFTPDRDAAREELATVRRELVENATDSTDHEAVVAALEAKVSVRRMSCLEWMRGRLGGPCLVACIDN